MIYLSDDCRRHNDPLVPLVQILRTATTAAPAIWVLPLARRLSRRLVDLFSSVCVNKSYTSYGNKSYQMRWKNCFYTIKLYFGNILYIHWKRKNIHHVQILHNFAPTNDKFRCLTYYFSPYNINYPSTQQMLPTGNGKCLYDCRNLNNRRNIWQYIYRGKDSSPTHEID